MKNLLLLAALTGGIAAISGCQVSGDKHVDTNNRPAGYTYSYKAVADTPYKGVDDDSISGTISKGTQVQFDGMSDRTMSWQKALLPDGHVRYVHPTDFEMAK